MKFVVQDAQRVQRGGLGDDETVLWMLGCRRPHAVVSSGDAHVLESGRDEPRDDEGISDEIPWVQVGADLRRPDGGAAPGSLRAISASHQYPLCSPMKVQSILCVVYDMMVQDRLEASMQPRFGSRGDLIANEIKRAILSGRYEAGSPLTEKAIAEELGTSKTPVRDALKALSGTGLVTSSSHRGTSVRTVDAPMAFAVCDLRLLLEPEAVRRTILRGLDAAAFETAVERMLAAEDGKDVYERSLANRAFHSQLYAG